MKKERKENLTLKIQALQVTSCFFLKKPWIFKQLTLNSIQNTRTWWS